MSTATLPSAEGWETVFAPVRSVTALEETVERLGTAIRLGLLAPGTRLPAERELSTRLGIARSTLRQALLALAQSGHLYATRGRGGGTFVADPQPPAGPPPPEVLSQWRELCDQRLAVEVGIAALVAARCSASRLEALLDLVSALEDLFEDFASYRLMDVRFHVALAEMTGIPALVASMTEIQGAMSWLISFIAHPPEVLRSSNEQHRALLGYLRRGDEMGAAQAMAEHVRATEHVLAGLLPG